MWAALQAPLFFGLAAAFAASVGLIAVAMRSDWSQRHSGMFALAAAGMLITLTLLHAAPAALERSPSGAQLLLAGFLAGLVANYSVSAIFGDGTRTGPTAAVTPLIAIALHSTMDGVIYAVTFAESFESGVFTASSLILHEFPEAVVAFAILRRHNVGNRRAFAIALAAAAFTTPLGVVISGPLIYGLGPEVVGALFALSAGLLLYVATGPLMAPLQSEPPGRSLTALGAGVAVAALLAASPLHKDAHTHGDSHQHKGPGGGVALQEPA